MKKGIVIIALLGFALSMTAQRKGPDIDSMPAPEGTDTTWYEKAFTGFSWSLHLNYRDFDTTNATLGIYSSNFHPDSNIYDLIWIDRDLDGSNDNPKTLSDSSWTIWGESFPFIWRVYKLTKNNVDTGKMLYYNYTKQ